MKKTCIIFHGHMRTFDKTHDSLKKYIENFEDIDIFIHTWNVVDRESPSYYDNSKVDIEEIDIDKINKLYKPKAILVEKQELKNPEITCPYNKISLEGHKYYFESFYKANELKINYEKENNFVYDFVIKLRPDVIFKEPLNLSKLNDDTSYLFGNPINNNADLHSIGNFRAFNVITISNSENMNKIANFYTVMDEYIFVKLHKHSDFVDYIINLNLDLEIIEYFYGKHWGFVRM